jgi:phosphatidylglycerophosphatase A
MRRSPPAGTPLLLRLATTGFLIGEAAPFAPATFTSLAVLPLIWFFVDIAAWWQVILTLAVAAVGVPLCTRAERYYGHDAGALTIDEVAGMLVTFLFVPAGAGMDRVWVLGVGFLLFRVFDIVKPPPAGAAQRLPGGMGVMLDDVWAGVYANVILRLLILFTGLGG